MANSTVTQKVSEAGHRRFWEARQMLGKDAKGQPITREVFVDMATSVGGREPVVHAPERGWDGEPPSLASGDPGNVPAYRPPSQRYRDNFSRIDWST